MTSEGQRFLRSLTPRQRSMVVCLAEGRNNRDIAERCRTNEQVVRNSLRPIFQKGRSRSRLELVIFCYRNGVVNCPCGAATERTCAGGPAAWWHCPNCRMSWKTPAGRCFYCGYGCGEALP